MSRRSVVQATRKMSSNCDLVISVKLTHHDTAIEAFIGKRNNVIFANIFKNLYSPRLRSSLCMCGAQSGRMLLVRLAIKKFLRQRMCP